MEDSNKNMTVESTIPGKDPEYRLGLGKWRPYWLQRFNSLKWFLSMLSICSLAQGIVIYGLVAVAVESIEKEFGISSKVSGVILASQHVATFILVTFVSFFGANKNKPVWMAVGSAITALGAFIFILPKLISGPYQPAMDKQDSGMDLCDINKTLATTQLSCDETVSMNRMLHVVLFVVGQLLMGAGTTPHYTLGPAYIDENVAPTTSPIYLGIWFTFAMLGPSLGFLVGGAFLEIYTDIEVSEDLVPQVRGGQWVGAWWLGFIVISVVFLMTTCIIVLFPRQMKLGHEEREEWVKRGHLPSPDDGVKFSVRGYVMETMRLCSNKVFLFMVLGMTLQSMYGAGVWGFVIKVTVLKFGVTPAKAGMVIGVGLMVAMIFGIMGGSFIMKKVEVRLATKNGAFLCTFISLCYTTSAFIWLVKGCGTTNVAGVTVSYPNTSYSHSLDSACNAQCRCSKLNHKTLCGSDGLTYYSPCFAGCTSKTQRVDQKIIFSNCSCLAKSILNLGNGTDGMKGNNTEAKYAGDEKYATLGKCDRRCRNFYLFVILVIITSVIGALGGIPHKIVIMRCVPDNKRSFALGLKAGIIRMMTPPAPVIVGTFVDIDCIIWAHDDCGKRLHCLDYDIDLLSFKLLNIGAITAFGGTILYAFGWWFSPDPPVTTANQSPSNQDSVM